MLRRANAHLRATRDALLPRLISGKLRVEALDIQFPPSMQPLPAEAAPREAIAR
jgi:type I restriction enzyme S subunit